MAVFLPPMKIAQGEPFSYDVTVVGVSWTGYTGTATFRTKPQARGFRRDATTEFGTVPEPIVSVSVTADSTGLIQFSLTAAQTATFPALPRVGYFRQAVCEISMTNGSDVQKFQASVSVASEL